MQPPRRYDAIQMLADQLNRSRGYGIPNMGGLPPELMQMLGRKGTPQPYGGNPEMMEGLGSPQLPPGLPDIVQESIHERPSYGEGQIMAPHQWYNPAFNEEQWRPEDSPERRESQLSNELNLNRFLRREGEWPVPEGKLLTNLPPGRSPYSSRELGFGYPFALY